MCTIELGKHQSGKDFMFEEEPTEKKIEWEIIVWNCRRKMARHVKH